MLPTGMTPYDTMASEYEIKVEIIVDGLEKAEVTEARL